MRSALDAARDEADRARTKLADASAREADHARRFSLVHEELAEARAEIATLHRHLERSEALREEIAGHLFEAGAREDGEELVRLRQKVLADDQRALISDRTVARLRERVEELVSSRDTLLTRIAEWQQLIREDGPEAADLSEFLAELRHEILDLEHRNVISTAREAALRERLAMAGIDPDEESAEARPTAGPEVPEAAPAAVPSETVELVAVLRHEPAAPSDGPAADEELEELEEVAAEGGAAESNGPATVPRDAAKAPPTEEAVGDAGDPAVGANSEVLDDAENVDDPEPADAAEPPLLTPSGDMAAPSRADALKAALGDAGLPTLQADLLLRLGRSGDASAVDAVHPWTESSEPSVRAAAYEALGRLLERAPAALEPHLRAGLADPDARVRRRVVLATATARGLASHALLDPLREDPDPQVRRVIRQVLRQAEAARDPSVPNRTLRA